MKILIDHVQFLTHILQPPKGIDKEGHVTWKPDICYICFYHKQQVKRLNNGDRRLSNRLSVSSLTTNVYDQTHFCITFITRLYDHMLSNILHKTETSWDNTNSD